MTNHERFMRIPPKALIEKNFAWHMVFFSFVEENQKYCARMKPNITICRKCVNEWLSRKDESGMSNHQRLFSMNSTELALELDVAGCALVPDKHKQCDGNAEGNMCSYCLYRWLEMEEEK